MVSLTTFTVPWRKKPETTGGANVAFQRVVCWGFEKPPKSSQLKHLELGCFYSYPKPLPCSVKFEQIVLGLCSLRGPAACIFGLFGFGTLQRHAGDLVYNKTGTLMLICQYNTLSIVILREKHNSMVTLSMEPYWYFLFELQISVPSYFGGWVTATIRRVFQWS